MKKNNIVIGVIFVVLGVLFLVNTSGFIKIDIGFFDIMFLFAKFWPFFLIIPGLAMHSIFFSGKSKDAGILVPAAIFLVSGIVCQVSMLFPRLWGITWPGFILGVAVGLFELYLFGNRNKGLLIPVGILTILSIIFFDMFTFRWLRIFHLKEVLIGAVLIIVGISIIFKNKKGRDEF